MNQWDALRQLARQQHAEARAQVTNDTAAALLAAAAALTGIACHGVPADDPLLDGAEAMLDPDARTIWFNRDADPLIIPYYEAHEYGHFWIDGARAACREADLDSEATEERIPLGVQRVDGYGPQERRECQANVFAREFLLPSDLLQQWFAVERLGAEEIAARVGLSSAIVFHQLTFSLLTPGIHEEAAPTEAKDTVGAAELDPSQKEAAEVLNGPLLVDAGPGTGKTKTLIGRIAFLLRELGVDPTAILALTFSNKAAEEMRERVGRIAPDAAPHIWMGTFHAFGLELLRKYGTLIGLQPKVDVLDPATAVLVLEGALPALQLNHYQNLYDPTIALRDILGAISRAKDELVGPGRYLELAERMRDNAASDDEREAAEKALEVARTYAFYQAYLDREQRLDYGDLIFKSVELLGSNETVKADVRQTYRYILVDEYQDVNRASGILLREIAGDGRGLWVVGDIRQSIYRFRGAAPANVRLFSEDFPGGRTLSLDSNYRSQPRVIDAFASVASRMRSAPSGSYTPWQAKRADTGGQILMEIAEDLDAEAFGLAREIERQRAKGIPYSQQAILCRSHTDLARIATPLERAGVPILYFGDLFERSEIRDLLALLSLACDGDGRGLIRVARFAEYDLALDDVRILRDLARQQNVPFPRALLLAGSVPAISDRSKEGLARLSSHLDGLCYGTSAWATLANYLFERSAYLRSLLDDQSVRGLQCRLAIYQFLLFAHERRGMPAGGGQDPKREFLEYVRRLEILGDEKQLRQLPTCADGLDAVRLLTIHASKGLEFCAVYVPILGQGHFPSRRQAQACPPPIGMLPDGTEDGHDEEEECLFFVALSRAKDFLCLSRARRYRDQNSNPSSLLSLVQGIVPRRPDGDVTWPSEQPVVKVPPNARAMPSEPPVFDVMALDRYLTCPLQYFYEYVLGLGGKRDDTAYVQFHRCVYDVIHWIQSERAAGRIVDETLALRHLADAWAANGPVDHPYEEIYRQNAEAMVGRALFWQSISKQPVEHPVWEVPLPHGRVRFAPDHVQVLDDGTKLVQRLRTGRISRSEKNKDIYALYQAAGRGTKGRRQIQIVSLSADAAEPVRLSEKTVNTRLTHYDDAIVGILANQFPARVSDRECPRCPHYFICTSSDGV